MVSTDVGGIRTVIEPVDSEHVVPVDDEVALVDAVRQALASANGKELRRSAQEHMTGRFAVERLVDDVDRLYRRLLEERQQGPVGSAWVYEQGSPSGQP